MELVYLWVDKYKNIKDEGFNFSSRFDCSYDRKNLTIKDKENIENLFDENGMINITAIVGENGSGKSSILECLSHPECSVYNEKGEKVKIKDNFDVLLLNENTNSNLYTNKLNVNQQILNRFLLNDTNIEI